MQTRTTTRLRLPADAKSEIARWSSEGYPHEVCGCLIGTQEGGAVRVGRVVRGKNLQRERPQDRYELDPLALLSAEDQARQAGLEVVGVWHSHPDHPASPSETDRRGAWEGWSYLIVSISADGVWDLRSWRLVDNQFFEEEIQVMTQAIVRIPAPLRSFTDGAAELAVEADRVSTALRELGRRHEGLLGRVLDEQGSLRPFVNLFIGSTNLRELDGLETELREGDVLSILPAVAGGDRS